MNYKQITKISCRLIAIAVFFKFLYYVQNIASSLIQTKMSQGALDPAYLKDVIVLTLPLTAGTLLIGIILWALSGILASSIANSYENDIKQFNINYGKLFGMAIAIIGVYFAVATLQDFMPVLYTDLSYRKQGQPDPTFKVQYIAFAIKFIITIAVVVIGRMKFTAAEEKAADISNINTVPANETEQEEQIEEAVVQENTCEVSEEALNEEDETKPE